jgi:hypothetical protein
MPDLQPVDDEDHAENAVLALIAAGSHTALAELYRRHERNCYKSETHAPALHMQPSTYAIRGGPRAAPINRRELGFTWLISAGRGHVIRGTQNRWATDGPVSPLIQDGRFDAHRLALRVVGSDRSLGRNRR